MLDETNNYERIDLSMKEKKGKGKVRKKITNLISCVIAVCPMNFCGQGIDNRKMEKLLPCSSWSYQGKELPYTHLQYNKGRMLKDMLKYREVRMRSFYEGMVEHAPREALISVENIQGPLLFLSAEQDAMWPAKEASEAMMRRLEKYGFPYAHQHYNYEYASHFLIPYKLKSVKMFAVERKYPDKCMESNLDSFEKTLEFLKAW